MDAALLDRAYADVSDLVSALSEPDFARPTRAAAWSVRELLFHQLLDAQRALEAFASTTDEPPDVDEVGYWAPFRPGEGDGGAAHARFVRVAASAYAAPRGLVDHWESASRAAVRAAHAADPLARVRTQGHVLTVPAFLSTLVVEATVHLLDLTLELPGGPGSEALAETRRVLEGRYGGPLPARWDDTRAVLLATGRGHLSEADRGELGERAAELPLLG